MKKIFMVFGLLILSIVLIPVNSQADLSTFYFDPIDDVLLVNAIGRKTPTTGLSELDIVTMSTSEYQQFTYDWIEFEIVVNGTIEDSDQTIYMLLIKTNTGEYLMQYGNGIVRAINASNEQILIGVSAEASNDTLTVSVQKANLGNPTDIKWKAIAVKQIDDDTQYVDMAPDKIPRVMRPVEGSTLYGSVTIEGRTRASINAIIDVQIKIDDSGWHSVTPGSPANYDKWTYTWDTSQASNGVHTISVRANDGSQWLEDDINGDQLIVYVDQSAATIPDTFTETMLVNVDDAYYYNQTEPSEFEFGDIGTIDKAFQKVVGYTDSYNGSNIEAWIIKFHTEAHTTIAGFTATQKVDAVIWRDNSNYNILEERFNSTIESNLMGENSLNSTTKYTPIFDDFDDNGGMWVTKSWTETPFADTDYSTYSSRYGQQHHTDDRTLTVYFECLRKENVNVFGTNYEVYLIHSEEEGSESYDIQYYAPSIDAFVKLEKYDFNRMKIASLGLRNYTKGPVLKIIDNSPQAATTGDLYTFNASIIRNQSEPTVTLTYWFGEGIPTTSTMERAPQSGYALEIMIPPDKLDALHYNISANDSQNEVRTGNKDIPVLDDDNPLAHLNISGAIQGYYLNSSAITFNASTSTDNIGVIDYFWTIFEDGQLYRTMSQEVESTSLDPRVYNVTLSAYDAANNWNTSSISLIVYLDTDGDTEPDIIDTDDDNDALPDAWEEKYGLNSTDASDAKRDSDGDGYTNVEEYKENKNPLDPKSRPGLLYNYWWVFLIIISVVVAGLVGLIKKRPPKSSQNIPEDVDKNEVAPYEVKEQEPDGGGSSR